MSRHLRAHLASLSIALAGATSALAQSSPAPHSNADVPITKVVLFSSGVGYFEHDGTVRGNSATQLRFKTDQINDILKSIVLEDRDGGRVGVITYPSQDPVQKTLRSFEVDITNNPTLAELLNQLRGAHVTVDTPTGTASGTILGVETHQTLGDKGAVINQPVLNLISGATIRTVTLSTVRNLSLDDRQLQDELTRALGALTQARDQDKKPVTINFTGAGERRVRIGYVVETPVWKTSYRLILGDSAHATRLQGWAIVENQTESDWNDVSLSLVSGRPISFTMDLYQPLYASRPNVVPELYASLRPQVYEGGITQSLAKSGVVPARPGVPAAAARAAPPAGTPFGAVRLNEVVTTATDDSGYRSEAEARGDLSEAAIAAASKLGELFQYAVPNVTLARQKSAMLPIIADSVVAERVSIYNSRVLPTHPLNGVWLTNTSGKHLLQGPVTVLDGGGYAGDAQIDDIPPGQKRLLSYGIDLDTYVSTPPSGGLFDTILSAKIDKGILLVKHHWVEEHTFTAQNSSTNDKTLIIEEPVMQGWRLLDSTAAIETTPSAYRLKEILPPNKVVSLTVKQKRAFDETVAMVTVDSVQLLRFSQTRELPPAIRDAVDRALALRRTVQAIQADIASHTQRIAAITAEQGRIRDNMKTVAEKTDYYKRLLAKLNDQESMIESLQKERDDLTAKVAAAHAQLEDYVSHLTIN